MNGVLLVFQLGQQTGWNRSMEESLHQELQAKTKQALDAGDWNAVLRLWQLWIEQVKLPVGRAQKSGF